MPSRKTRSLSPGTACPGRDSIHKSEIIARDCRRQAERKTGDDTNEAIRPHRKAARHQARERLELEVHLRKARRLFRSADRRRRSWADEIDKTAGRERRRAVRPGEIRNRDAQRNADARHGDATDRSPDLSFLRAGDGQWPGVESADRGRVW